jgi:hypothetical protein
VGIFLGDSDDRNAIAILLRQHIESGLADPSARSALFKIQKTKGGSSVNLNEGEISSIVRLLRGILDGYHWFPMEGRSYPTRTGWLPGPTRQLTSKEVKELGRELYGETEGWRKLENLGVPEEDIVQILSEVEQ